MRSAGAWLPGLHGVGMMAPVVQKLPSGHGEHAALLFRSVRLVKLPLSHGSGAAEPSEQ